ncbi:papain fold toxin 1 (glutamine deamidase) of polymorphic toxin system [Amycolatopsis echigonensis]|uniref:Papain fold toxin 1 (Glutamine deamidase) of polymorphic toxin system n=1 Tax=Amycolatopsis echigonensis TaxID=2576905 RepID=A0A2N3X292_9PSEU|nr:YrhB domain-containing protein [Amycolatopsis niigatensis]PKW00241.1 papain fold toxin 1 (glutamine deamidase) of polymorphic toxin system [Amycolatopsis niigatensis]
MTEEARRAQEWLRHTYGDRVVLHDAEPVYAGERAVLFGCRYTDDTEPMLAAAVWAPRDGSEPFPAANADPLDEELNLSGPRDAAQWRLNARNCVVAADAALGNHPASAVAWHPEDEAPGWWDRLLTTYFPGAEVTACAEWEQAEKTILDGGPGTRGVVWLRRRFGGRELTGHLLFAEHGETGVVFLDPQRGSYADTSDTAVDELVVARFPGSLPADAPDFAAPWEAAAADLPAAVEKAGQWLKCTYADDVQLVAPEPDDETERGRLFAVTTRRFAETGDWRDQMLDAALVVPKAEGQAPFGLPNRDPWTWLRDWDSRTPGLPEPPDPAEAAWFAPTVARLGAVESVRAYRDWPGVLDQISGFPAGTRTLVWVRRKDSRGRETVGHLLWAVPDGDGVRLLDPLSDTGEPLIDPAPFELRTIRIAD